MVQDSSVFVTCGATVAFPRLVECVVNDAFIKRASQKGFRRVIVQYGKDFNEQFEEIVHSLNGDITPIVNNNNNNNSSEYLQRIKELDPDIEISGFQRNDNIKTDDNIQFEILGFAYSNNLQSIIKQSNIQLIISHAGTGSILDSLRLQKKMIVVVNDSLMDNHQQQIADKFTQLGYVWSCLPVEDQILKCLDKSMKHSLNSFPKSFNRDFQNLLVTRSNI